MDDKKKTSAGKSPADENLVTERDIDDESGLFQEGTYPGALPEEDQEAAVNEAISNHAKRS
ncbi:hypothetical protein [Paenibacillus sp. S150]|uniref:hypothetical protein n=1 Tax=Paenibacillus sp. S150 TaxID=2749826 RepID=UPI001C59CB51|nr:hypothetical protein [Paenibacillus sp. S150]MBW4084408.1 hypothetical protein [Paenibacillus sp. S150]